MNPRLGSAKSRLPINNHLAERTILVRPVCLKVVFKECSPNPHHPLELQILESLTSPSETDILWLRLSKLHLHGPLVFVVHTPVGKPMASRVKGNKVCPWLSYVFHGQIPPVWTGCTGTLRTHLLTPTPKSRSPPPLNTHIHSTPVVSWRFWFGICEEGGESEISIFPKF